MKPSKKDAIRLPSENWCVAGDDCVFGYHPNKGCPETQGKLDCIDQETQKSYVFYPISKTVENSKKGS